MRKKRFIWLWKEHYLQRYKHKQAYVCVYVCVCVCVCVFADNRNRMWWIQKYNYLMSKNIERRQEWRRIR